MKETLTRWKTSSFFLSYEHQENYKRDGMALKPYSQFSPKSSSFGAAGQICACLSRAHNSKGQLIILTPSESSVATANHFCHIR